jgi:hypothetical protein
VKTAIDGFRLKFWRLLVTIYSEKLMGKKEKSKVKRDDRPKSEREPALCAQPQPESDMFDLWPLVVKDMEDRDKLGRARYGIPLRPQNGRDALVDAYQEVLDLSVYLRQEIEERRMLSNAISAAQQVPGFERTTAATLDKVITHLLDTAESQRALNRLMTAKLVDYQTNKQYVTGFCEGVEAALDLIEEQRDIGAITPVTERALRDALSKRMSDAGA